MLQDFWQQKKHLVQIVGILIAAGAMFLSIPQPENDVARSALQNLQFIWLVLVSVSTIMLLVQLLRLVILYERKAKTQDGFDFSESLSLMFTLVIFFFLTNLWKYAAAIYLDSFFEMMRLVNSGLAIFAAAVGFEVWRRLLHLYGEKSRILRLVIIFAVPALVIFLITAWLGFIANRGSLDSFRWLLISVGTYAMSLIIIFIVDWAKTKWPVA